MLYSIARAIIRPIIFLLYRPKIDGYENFPLEGKTIIFSNHLSLMDPILIGCILPRQVFFMAKMELFRFPIFSWLLKKLGAFPVKRGTADLSAIKHSLQVLKEDKVFGIFPEGTRNKEGQVKTFSHGVAAIAHKSKAQTVPIAIIGKYEIFKPMKIKIGKPLDFNKYYIRKSSTELLEEITLEMEEALKDLLNSADVA